MSRPNSVNAACSSRAQDDIDAFKQFHDDGYLFVTNALSLEEEGEPRAAIILYEKALRLLDQALSFVSDGPNRRGPKWDEIKIAQHKMRQTRLQILERLVALRTVHTPPPTSPPSEMPPSYEEATTPQWSLQYSNVNAPGTFDGSCTQSRSSEPTRHALREKVSELSAANAGLQPESVMSTVPPEAEIIFSLPDVQLFFVSSDGFVSAPSYPTSLKIYKFIGSLNEALSPNQVTGWLQVETWVFPLIPSRSPVLQTNYGAYIFPDITSVGAGAAVGVLLPDSIGPDLRLTFETILCELTAVRLEGTTITREEVTAEEERLSHRISAGIIRGAELLAKGVGYGAEVTSKLVHRGASSLRHKINPTNQPQSIDPRVQKSLQVARDVTGAAVSVSSFLVRKVGDATVALGRFLAPHIRDKGSLLLSKAFREDQSRVNHKMDDVLQVASGGLRGFATVYLSLESAARLLASSLANETVQIVNYRYGNAIGDVTDNAVRTVGNVAMTAYNINTVGVKGIAKKTAKNTGKALVEDFEERKSKSSESTTNAASCSKSTSPTSDKDLFKS